MHPEEEDTALQDGWGTESRVSLCSAMVSLRGLGLMITAGLQRRMLLLSVKENEAPE